MQHESSQIPRSVRACRRLDRPRFLRPVSLATVAVTVSMLIGGAGFADAATGGTFILGKANKETSTASLSDTKGTPLALSAPAGTAPLAVNDNVMVKNLNAQYLGGLTATGLAETGGEGFTAPFTNTPIGTTAAVVASTGKLPAGTYYVSATATLVIETGDNVGECWIATGSAPDTEINVGSVGLQGTSFNFAETAAVKMTAGGTLVESCDTGGNNGSYALDAGIIAIRILYSSHQ